MTQEMNDTLATVMAKLKEVRASVADLSDPAKVKDHKWTFGGGAQDKARAALQQVNQAILAVEEATGTVDVPRRGHTIKEDDASYKTGFKEGHESFGVIQITRPTGKMKLVGTTSDSLPSCVKLAVYRADRFVDTHTHTEHYFHHGGGRPLLEIEMSMYQWAEAICNMNGVMNPCTIRAVMGTSMENVPDRVTTPMEQIINDTHKEINPDKDVKKKFSEDVENVVAMIPDLKVSKKKAEALEKAIRRLLEDNVEAPERARKWATRMFSEATEKAVSTAKVEMESALAGLINRTGLSALKGELSGFENLQLVSKKEGE